MNFATRTHYQRALYLTLVLFSSLILSAVIFAPNNIAPAPASIKPLSSEQLRQAYGRIELSFEPNQGQTDQSVDFLTRGAGYTLFLRPTDAVFGLQKSDCRLRNEDAASFTSKTADTLSGTTPQPAICNHQSNVLRLALVGSDPHARVEGLDRLTSTVNYFVGSDPAKWHANLSTFKRVRYREIYPGIDVIYYGNQRQLEYDFVVAPGRDPRLVKIQFTGADKVTVDPEGNLLLTMGETVLRQAQPVVYQEVAGVRRSVEGGYTIERDGTVGFALGEYDSQLPLVIDPTLVYSTYFGAGGTDEARDIVVDFSGNAYICGNTSSTNFPVVNAVQGTFGGGNFFGARDVFVSKLNATGTGLFYSTYLGGGGDDRCGRLALDSAGNAYIAGETTSTNFPTANALQATSGGGSSDAFVTKLNSTGSAFFYSTYLGGNTFDGAASISVDSSGNAYVTGRTTSPNFPVANALQSTFSGGSNADAFVTKFNASGSGLFYSTYLGGNGGIGFDAGEGIAVDSVGNVYVTGRTSSTNFPLVNPIQNTFGGGFPDGDAFVTKINAPGNALVYSTYLGGSDNDLALDIALDSTGRAYITGSTASMNFPTANAFQVGYAGGGDAFVTRINSTGSALTFSTYLGGGNNDTGNDIAVDSSFHAYVAGATVSVNFPLANPFQGTNIGGFADAFVTKFNVAGTALIYSSYLGGSNADRANTIAVDSAGSAYVAGITGSTNFPTFNAGQGTKDVAEDAFITKISDPPATVVQFSSANYNTPEECSFVTITLSRLGDLTGETTVEFLTTDGTAIQRTDYTLGAGAVRFAVGETSKTFRVLISEDAYVEGNESFNVILSNGFGGGLGTPAAATVTITEDDTTDPPIVNPIDDSNIFVRQHYHDFLAREGDSSGVAFWIDTITQCGSDQSCINAKRIAVSDAFFFEPEFQQTGAYVYRIYRESFGNNQPFPNPNPDPANPGEERKVPLYLQFMRDRSRVRGGAILAQLQLEFANVFVQRAEFITKYPLSLDGPGFVDAVLATLSSDIGVNLSGQRQALINLFNAAPNSIAGRANVIYRLADDNVQNNPINNRVFIDAEYNRSFVYTAYAGYLRRNADMPGFLFWLAQINSAPLRDINKQHAIVCSFITAAEYQRRFSSVVTHNNTECL